MGSNFNGVFKNQMDKINNREKFTYDLNGDALYQQYKDQYMNQGKLAMQDAMGQAAAMTGGYGNSYADAVGNQAYQGYLSKLNDVVPELYQMALNRYQQEGQDMKDVYSMLQNQYDTEYGEYRDRQNDWANEQNRLDQNYFNESQFDYNRFSDNRSYYSNLYNAALDWATNDANADYSNRFNEYQQRVSEDQWAKNYQLEKDQLAASKAANDQSAKIAELNALIADRDKQSSAQKTNIEKQIKEIVSGADYKNKALSLVKNKKIDQELNAFLNTMVKTGVISREDAVEYYGKYRVSDNSKIERR